MNISSNLVATLRIVCIRNDRVTRRLNSLCVEAWDAPTPGVCVFRRDGAVIRPTIKARASSRFDNQIAVARQTRTAQFWAPTMQGMLSAA